MSEGNTTSRSAVAIVVFIALFCVVPPSFAQGNISIGRFEIHPGAKYAVESDSNIYLESSEEQDDIIHKYAPALSLRYAGTRPGNYVMVGHKADFASYTDFDDNSFDSQNSSVEAGYESPAGIFIKARISGVDTDDPYGSLNTYGIGRKTERWNNTVNLGFGYRYGPYSIEVDYRNYLEEYGLESDQWQNREDDEAGLSLFFHVTAKMAILLNYRWAQTEYEEQNDGVLGWSAETSQDHTKSSYYIGARFEPGGRLSGDIRFGWGEKLWGNLSNRDGHFYRDQDSWLADTSVTYDATARMRITLGITRSHAGSPDGVAAGTLDTRLTAGVSQKLGVRFSAKLGLGYTNIDYQDENPGNAEKTLELYELTVGLDYEIRPWLKTGLSYRYQDKQAGDAAYLTDEYESSIATFYMNAAW